MSRGSSLGWMAAFVGGLLTVSMMAVQAHAQVAPGGTWQTSPNPAPYPNTQPGAAATYPSPAGAVYPGNAGYPGATGYPPGYAGAPYYPPTQTSTSATDLEVGSLYGFSAAYGVGTGIWIDAEADIEDPGLQFIAPALLGVGAPVGVFFLNRPTMPRGMPAAIATGMAIGAGEGVGIATYQMVSAKPDEEWGFRGLTRSVFIGSTLGTAAGIASAYYMEPSPRQSLMLGSSVLWGTVIGSMFGYGGTRAHSDWTHGNDFAALGGLIGYNVGLVGAAAVSAAWVPSYESLAWMWGGFGAGIVVSLPVYLFYVGGDHDARRGLVFQGAAGTLGVLAGALFTIDRRDFGASGARHVARREEAAARRSPIGLRLTGGGLMPVRDGVGLQVQGVLF